MSFTLLRVLGEWMRRWWAVGNGNDNWHVSWWFWGISNVYCNILAFMWIGILTLQSHCCEWWLSLIAIIKSKMIMNADDADNHDTCSDGSVRQCHDAWADYGDSHYEGCGAMVVWISSHPQLLWWYLLKPMVFVRRQAETTPFFFGLGNLQHSTLSQWTLKKKFELYFLYQLWYPQEFKRLAIG